VEERRLQILLFFFFFSPVMEWPRRAFVFSFDRLYRRALAERPPLSDWERVFSLSSILIPGRRIASIRLFVPFPLSPRCACVSRPSFLPSSPFLPVKDQAGHRVVVSCSIFLLFFLLAQDNTNG